MAEKHAVDPAEARLDVHVNVGPIDTGIWKLPPAPDPCACPVTAVHRTGMNEPGGQGVAVGSLPPGNSVPPPLAQMYLAPGSYVVSARFLLSSNLGAGGIVFAYLGSRGQGTLSWAWLRMPAHGAPGDGQTVSLQGVLTLATGDSVGVDASGGAQNGTFLASDIWLIAQRTGVATVQTL
jgi:hypothetical protein